MKKILLSIILANGILAGAFASTIPHASLPPSSIVSTPYNGKIRVYPNPATDFIQISNAEQASHVSIYNIVGRLIKDFKDISPDEKLSVSNLPTGLYIVRISDREGKTLATLRMSKR